jgi:hypothetical protein
MPRVGFRAFAVLAAAVAAPAFAQTTPIGIVNGTYFENFNSMGTGAPSYPVGWNGYKTAGTSGLQVGSFITTTTSPAFTTNNGGLATGTVYNYGTTGDADRALGTVASGSNILAFGVVLVNNTGRTLTSTDIEIAFRAEQWRSGGSAAENEVWTFQWQTGNATLDVNELAQTFNTDAAFNINEILIGTATGIAVDGNANFVNIGAGTLAGLVWNPNERLVLRWLDSDNPNTDAGMAIDDFRFTVFAPVPEPSSAGLIGVAAVSAWVFRRRRAAA